MREACLISLPDIVSSSSKYVNSRRVQLISVKMEMCSLFRGDALWRQLGHRSPALTDCAATLRLICFCLHSRVNLLRSLYCMLRYLCELDFVGHSVLLVTWQIVCQAAVFESIIVFYLVSIAYHLWDLESESGLGYYSTRPEQTDINTKRLLCFPRALECLFLTPTEIVLTVLSCQR